MKDVKFYIWKTFCPEEKKTAKKSMKFMLFYPETHEFQPFGLEFDIFSHLVRKTKPGSRISYLLDNSKYPESLDF